MIRQGQAEKESHHRYLWFPRTRLRMAVTRTRDRCYDFLNIFAEKFSEKIGVFDSKQS
jgi:hypothetical protein